MRAAVSDFEDHWQLIAEAALTGRGLTIDIGNLPGSVVKIILKHQDALAKAQQA